MKIKDAYSPWLKKNIIQPTAPAMLDVAYAPPNSSGNKYDKSLSSCRVYFKTSGAHRVKSLRINRASVPPASK
jgi:hypothetical protein